MRFSLLVFLAFSLWPSFLTAGLTQRVQARLVGQVAMTQIGSDKNLSPRPSTDGVINVQDCEAKGDGVTDDTAAIQRALTAANSARGGTAYMPAGTYLTSATLAIPQGVSLVGAGSGTVLRYTGSGSALLLSGNYYTVVRDFMLQTTHTAANGIEAGNATRQSEFRNLSINGDSMVSNTGAGIYLNAGTGWSGGLNIHNVYVTGYKHGIMCVGESLSPANTWTCVDCTGVMLAGRSAGVIAGSTGFSFDANTNGVGTEFRGGTIEGYEYGVYHENGGHGGRFVCDFEGNTNNYSVGASFMGEIRSPANGAYLVKTTNGTANVWHQEHHLYGERTIETRYSQRHVIYVPDAGAVWGVYTGTIGFIDGGTPTFAGGFLVNGADTPEGAQIGLMSHRMTWGAAAPSSGTWARGDVTWRTGGGQGLGAGWICTAAGTPGTWSQFGQIVETSACLAPKTIIKTIDVDNDASTDDYQFNDDAADAAEQVITLTDILPGYAELTGFQIRCLETVTGSTKMGVKFGTTSGGEEIMALSNIHSTNDVGGTSAGRGPILAATNAVRSLYISATPGANWNTLDAGRWAVMITYVDYGAVYTRKSP
jgi:hypothetical protein